MSKNNLQKYLNYLNEKNEKLSEILQYTKSKNFKIEEKEVEYIKLFLRKRERLFKELNIIAKNIEDFEKTNKNITSNEDISLLKEKSKDIIKKIIKIDNLNKVIFEQIFLLVKENIKNTKNNSKINMKYLGVYDSNFVGVNFDRSR